MEEGGKGAHPGKGKIVGHGGAVGGPWDPQGPTAGRSVGSALWEEARPVGGSVPCGRKRFHSGEEGRAWRARSARVGLVRAVRWVADGSA